MRAWLGPLVVVATLPFAAGCSFVAVRGPPPRSSRSSLDDGCTRDSAAPIADAVAAGLLGLGGIAGLTARDDGCGTGRECYFDGAAAARSVGVVMLAAGVVTALSSLQGFWVTHSCRAWMDRRDACRGGDAAACAGFAPLPSTPAETTPRSP